MQHSATGDDQRKDPLGKTGGDAASGQAAPGSGELPPGSSGDAAAPGALLTLDSRGTVALCDRSLPGLLGLTAPGVIGRDLGELLFGSDQSPTCPEILALAAGTGSWSDTAAVTRADGSRFSARLTVTALLGLDPTPAGYHCLLEPTPNPAPFDHGCASLSGAVLEAMPHPVYLKDRQGLYRDCNAHFAEFLGLDRTDILGKRAGEIDSPESDSVEMLRAMRPTDHAGSTGTVHPVRRCDGTRRTLFFLETELVDESGQLRGSVGIISDLTEQTRTKEEQLLQATMLEEEIAKHQRAEEALRQREKMLSLVINAVPQTIFWKDTDSVYSGCNEAFAHAAGLASPAEVVGKTDYDLPWTREESDAYRNDDREVMRLDRAKYHITETQLQADGNLRTVDTTKIPLHGDGGLVVGVLGVYEDISQRVRVERELKESEERLRVIFEASQAGIILVTPDGTISFANRRMAEMCGVSLDELLGTQYLSWLMPTDLPSGANLAARLGSGEIESVTVERHYRRRDGSDFWGYLSGRRLQNSDGSLRALVGCIADVTELKASQGALQREKERLAVTLRSIGDGVITVGTDGRVVLMNRVAEELCGYSQDEAAGLPLDQVFRVVDERTRQPKDNAIARTLGSDEVVEQSGHGLLVSRDGSERIIVSKTAPIRDRDQRIPGVVLVFSDITERRNIEEELFKARKLESLGILAGGIAHDFNNLMTGIMGNMALSRATLPEQHQAAVFLDRARKGAEQSKALTQQLLTFSKGGAPVKKLTSISQVLTDSAIFALRGSNVRCDFDIAPDLWCAEIDTGQMSQVISNLVINADQAMPEGGSILIRAENVLPLEDNDQPRRIRITFKDSGHGISEEDLSRIYDPYFSTKATGNGLGLATVYAIVKNHDGDIRVFSRQGHGTTFALTLPAQQCAQEEPEAGAQPEEPARQTGGGRILLMDDEEAIREMAAAALTMFGYQPVVVCDGEEMLKRYRSDLERGERFEAVIMDLTIPGGMGGKEAVKRLLELDPRAVAVASSGYSEDQVMANFPDYGFAGVVSKPYTLRDLEAALKEIIARSKE